MLKIVHLNSVYGYGSTGKIVKDIHYKLLEIGYDSYVAYGRGENNSESNVNRFTSNLEFIQHIIATRAFDRHGFASSNSTDKLINFLDSIKPNIIHIHNLHGYYIHIHKLVKYINKKNIKVIWTLHDCWSFTGHCAHYDYIKCEKWKTQCGKCPQIREYPKSFFIDNSELNFKEKRSLFSSINNLTIVTPSKWLKEQVHMSYLNVKKTIVITNGIETSIFKKTTSKLRESMDLKNKYIILGVASKWTERKGLEEFIKLSKLLNEDEVILLIGVNKSSAKKLPSNIIGIERTKSIEELVSYYSTADVFINLTLEDTYPTVNLEAASCELPIVSYDTGGCKETLLGINDSLVEQGNILDVRNRISILRNENVGKYRCQTRIKDKTKMVKEYIDLYNRVNEE